MKLTKQVLKEMILEILQEDTISISRGAKKAQKDNCQTLLKNFKKLSPKERGKAYKDVPWDDFLEGEWRENYCSKGPFQKVMQHDKAIKAIHEITWKSINYESFAQLMNERIAGGGFVGSKIKDTSSCKWRFGDRRWKKNFPALEKEYSGYSKELFQAWLWAAKTGREPSMMKFPNYSHCNPKKTPKKVPALAGKKLPATTKQAAAAKKKPRWRRCREPKQYLKRGCYGNNIKKLQADLISINPGWEKLMGRQPTDGYFGSKTRKVVKRFQKMAGFRGRDVDGVVGPKTREALNKKIKLAEPLLKKLNEPSPQSVTSPVLKGNRGALLKMVQMLLRDKKTGFTPEEVEELRGLWTSLKSDFPTPLSKSSLKRLDQLLKRQRDASAIASGVKSIKAFVPK